jgi:hypothetical protein
MLAGDDDEITVAIHHPATNRDTGMRFVVSGPEGETRKRAAAQMRREYVGAHRVDNVTADEQEADDLHITALSLLDWSGVNLATGSPAPLNRENAVALFERVPFIFEQIRSAVHERSAFTRS